MQKENRFFEDFARMASGAAGSFMEMRREIDALVQAQVEKFLQKMNLVTKEEADTLREMLAKARITQEELEQRLQSVENQLSILTEGKPKSKKNP